MNTELEKAVANLIAESDPATVVEAVAKFCENQRSVGYREFACRLQSLLDNFSYGFTDEEDT
jgi:hypothetical protein